MRIKRTLITDFSSIILLTTFLLLSLRLISSCKSYLARGADEEVSSRNLKPEHETYRITRWKAGSKYYMSNNSRGIFFHLTDESQNFLDLRQTCAVEAAAFYNPMRPIQVYIRGKRDLIETRLTPWLDLLSSYINVEIILVDYDEYFRATPLEEFYEQVISKHIARYNAKVISQYVRLVTFYRGGGLYMDLDVLTTRPLNERILWNAFVFEAPENDILSSTMFHLEWKHPLIEETMTRLGNIISIESSAYPGEDYIGSIVTDLCAVLREDPKFSGFCFNVSLLPSHNVIPISVFHWEDFFKRIKNESFFDSSYSIKIHNDETRKKPIRMRSHSFISSLVRKHCPLTANFVAGKISGIM